jgi:cellulose synthase/poly-beta-1,6-N-acetylglucosamine synthase-like glycosyltransferase
MQQVTSEIVVFTDANSFLNKEALVRIVRHYKNPLVGAVAGEKRVCIQASDDATAGEGFYWKYESRLKQWDSDLFSVVGAAGELFSLRTALYEPVAPDTVLDDFLLSMSAVCKGYRIVYEPEAYAVETASASVREELKRKIRIAAGGIQSVGRLPQLFNFFRYPLLSFQYISHRVLRWTVTPFLLILVFVLNAWLFTGTGTVYTFVFGGQCIFYAAALVGWLLERKELRGKMLFVPYYFCVMNYAILAGIRRYISGKQQVAWDKAKRKV